MNHFLRGFFVGTAVGVLFAPMKGEELRQQVQRRFKSVSNSLAENDQFQQFSQQATQSVQSLTHSVAQSVANVSHDSVTGEAVSPVAAIKQATQSVQSLTHSVAQSVANVSHDSMTGEAVSPVAAIKQAASTVQQGTQHVAASVQQNAQALTSSVRTAATEKMTAINKPLSNLLQSNQSLNIKSLQSNQSPNVTPLSNRLQSNQALNLEIRSKLAAQGIRNTTDLLERTATQKQRAELALQLNTSASQIKSYVIQADLMRVEGIDADTAQLLEAAGVTGCQDFRQRNPESLHNHLEEIQATILGGQRVPAIELITRWIASAQGF